MIRLRVLAAGLALGASALQAQTPEPTRDATLALGRAVFRLAVASSVDSLVALADSAVGPPEALRPRLTDGLAQMAMQLGGEGAMTSERVMRVGGRLEYWRVSTYEMVPVPIIFRVIVGPSGRWLGFTAVPEMNAPAGEEVTP